METRFVFGVFYKTDSSIFYQAYKNLQWQEYTNRKKNLIIMWNDVALPIPYNFIRKLKGRYGHEWMIPQASKGPKKKRRLL